MQSLEAKVQYLFDRQEIADCVNRYARGVDRHDAGLLASVYHPGAVDEHGPYNGPIPEFVEWVNAFHSEGFLSHTHHITTHNCDIDGDTAHAESYCLYVLRRKDLSSVLMGGGRYIDRLERRDGQWKIVLRKVYIDWRANADASAFAKPFGYPAGTQDRTDPSYERPLMPSAA
jgi:hypothetical protein